MKKLFILLILLPSTAHAGLFEVFQAALTIAVIVGASPFVVAALAIGTFYFGGEAQRKAQAQAAENAKNAYNNSLQDRLATVVSAEAPAVYAYGRTKVGSAVVAMFTSGDHDQYRHLVCVHAAHECDAIEEIYIAGQPLGALDGSGFVTAGSYYAKSSTEAGNESHTTETFSLANTPIAGTLTITVQDTDSDNLVYSTPVPYTLNGTGVTVSNPSGLTYYCNYQWAKTTSYVRAQIHLGTASDPADATLLAEVPAMWPSTSVLRGLCYTVIRLNLDLADFQGGLPTIEVLLRGKKLYDVRTSTYAWSQNPALVIYDYLTSEMCGVESTDIPLQDYIDAANDCDTVISGGEPVGEAQYTINGTITSVMDQAKTLEQLAQAMGGFIVATTWHIQAGVYATSTFDLLQSDIVGTLSVTPGISDADVYNGIKGQFSGAANSYISTDYAPYQNSTYVGVDGRESWTNIDFPYTDTKQRIWNLCRIFMEDQRNAFTVRGVFSLKAWGLLIGQRVTLTSTFIGQSSKIYRVTDKKFNTEGTIELTLKEDVASIWDYADAVTADETPNTNLPNPFDIAALAYITCESVDIGTVLVQTDGTLYTSILVQWPAATTQAIISNGLIEVQWQRDQNTVWESLKVQGSDLYAYVSPVADGAQYTIRARCTDQYLNVSSDWVYAGHLVTALVTPPPDVTGFARTVVSDGILLTWDTSNAQIYDYEVRTGGTDWASATLLASVKASQLKVIPHTLTVAGVTDIVVWFIKAINTSHKYSGNAASVSLPIAAPAAPTGMRADVVDNNVLLYWSAPVAITQPISTYEIRRGATYAGADVVGLKSGLFTSVFEVVAGTYTYWITAIDIAGNYGVPNSIAAVVNQPPDYVLHANYASTFTGTLSSAVVSGSAIMLPVNTTETYTQHFTNNSWATPQDQITAGFPLFIEPTPAAGSYTEQWNIGSVLNSSKITATINSVAVSGAPVTSITISTAPDVAGSPGAWTDYGGSSIFATVAFHWVKLHVDVFAAASPPSGLDLLQINNINLRLDAKALHDNSDTPVHCLASDSGGTTVNFNKNFADVSSIGVTILAGTSAAYALYDFTDVPNPTYFKILLYDISGARADGYAGWDVTGV